MKKLLGGVLRKWRMFEPDSRAPYLHGGRRRPATLEVSHLQNDPFSRNGLLYHYGKKLIGTLLSECIYREPSRDNLEEGLNDAHTCINKYSLQVLRDVL